MTEVLLSPPTARRTAADGHPKRATTGMLQPGFLTTASRSATLAGVTIADGAAPSPRQIERLASTSGWPHRRPTFLISDLGHADVAPIVSALGATLSCLYPDGTQKFIRRLEDVLSGRASCLVAWTDGARGEPLVAGVAVSTPKGDNRVKLSTLWVSASCRGNGLGADLLDMSRQRWLASGIDRTHVTVRHRRAHLLEPLMRRFTFRYVTTVPNRYGLGQDESVFAWQRGQGAQHGRNGGHRH